MHEKQRPLSSGCFSKVKTARSSNFYFIVFNKTIIPLALVYMGNRKKKKKGPDNE